MNNIKFSSFSTFRLAAALGFLFLLAAMNPGPGLLQPLLAQGCSGIPTSECQALYALYQSTDGDNWSRNDNWKSPAPTAQWYGVTVSNGHVTGLSLDENLLYGEIPGRSGT